MFDLADVHFVKRIVVGTDDPAHVRSPEEVEAAIALLNRCLSESPKGTILGQEKNFTILNVGEHKVVLQWVVYHVGFSRKPFWLEE